MRPRWNRLQSIPQSVGPARSNGAGTACGAIGGRASDLAHLDIELLDSIAHLAGGHAQQSSRLGLDPAGVFESSDDAFPFVEAGVVEVVRRLHQVAAARQDAVLQTRQN